ncbi:MAG: peptidylprolyl isomerase [Bacteroidales bacterium]|nr:peptidylprolyl isomerase [Bacteroidales bacterium]
MRKITILTVLVLFVFSVFGQKIETLMTVGNKNVSADEFVHIYKKNNTDNLNEQSIDEYLELFKKFKLKVVEAESLKMDTSKAFIDELAGYRDQLAKPYLIENIKYDQLINEAYERNQSEIKLDIIFIKLKKNASPEDTILAYEKAVKVRNRILGGEDFGKVASETSDDRQAANNKGHLSYLPVLRIPYSIQSYAFSPEKNKLSMPLRTDYGYYLVKLADTRPAQGFVKVAHIMISSADQLSDEEKETKKNKVDSIYNRLQAGDKFEDLIIFSDDKGTAKKGGELPEFTTGRMVPEFEAVAFALKNPGDYGEPVKTTFGWHIIKLIEKKPPESMEEQKEKIRKTIEKDPERKKLVKEFVINKLKKEYNFKKLNGPDAFYSMVDSTIYKSKWVYQSDENSNKTLFVIKGKNFTENSFGKFIEINQKRNKTGEISSTVNKMYDDYIYESITDAEKAGLEDKHKEFKYLMQEYHDGMLLFDLMKNEIWDKASEDTIGLRKYYDDNIQIYNDQTELDISVFKYADDNHYNDAVKYLNKSRKKYTDDVLVKKVASDDAESFKKIEAGFYSKGQSIFADKVFRMMKENKLEDNQKIVNLSLENTMICINGKRKSKVKPFEEIKGVIIADYQMFLEENWMEDLKKKYKIKVDEKVLNKVKKSVN